MWLHVPRAVVPSEHSEVYREASEGKAMKVWQDD